MAVALGRVTPPDSLSHSRSFQIALGQRSLASHFLLRVQIIQDVSAALGLTNQDLLVSNKDSYIKKQHDTWLQQALPGLFVEVKTHLTHSTSRLDCVDFTYVILFEKLVERIQALMPRLKKIPQHTEMPVKGRNGDALHAKQGAGHITTLDSVFARDGLCRPDSPTWTYLRARAYAQNADLLRRRAETGKKSAEHATPTLSVLDRAMGVSDAHSVWPRLYARAHQENNRLLLWRAEQQSTQTTMSPNTRQILGARKGTG